MNELVQWGIVFIAMGQACLLYWLNYRNGRRKAEANPMSADEIESARQQVMTGRGGGRGAKMERFRVLSDPAYAAKRERQFSLLTRALIAVGVVLLVLGVV